MYAERLKDFDVPEWLEHRPIQFYINVTISTKALFGRCRGRSYEVNPYSSSMR